LRLWQLKTFLNKGFKKSSTITIVKCTVDNRILFGFDLLLSSGARSLNRIGLKFILLATEFTSKNKFGYKNIFPTFRSHTHDFCYEKILSSLELIQSYFQES